MFGIQYMTNVSLIRETPLIQFKDGKHLFWYRINREKGVLQRYFAIFYEKMGCQRLAVWLVP